MIACSFSYQLDEKHEECVRDWKKTVELDSSQENKKGLKDAEKQLKLSKRKDYYKILGLEKGTDSQDDIKKAYRKKAMLHHPGKCFVYSSQFGLITYTCTCR